MALDRPNPVRQDGGATPPKRENPALKEDELLRLLTAPTQEYVAAADLAKSLWPNDHDEKSRRQSLDSLLHRVTRKLEKANSAQVIENAYKKGYRLVSRDQPPTASAAVIPFRPASNASADKVPLSEFWQCYTAHGTKALLRSQSHLISDARWTLEQYEGNGHRLRDLLRANIHCTYLAPATALRDTEQLIRALTEPFLLPLVRARTEAETAVALEGWTRFHEYVHIVLTGPRTQPEEYLFLNTTLYPIALLYEINHKEGWVRLVKEGPDAFDHAECVQQSLPAHGHVIDVQPHLADPAVHVNAVHNALTKRFDAEFHPYLADLFAPTHLNPLSDALSRKPAASETARRATKTGS